jgi:hypothetical protein
MGASFGYKSFENHQLPPVVAKSYDLAVEYDIPFVDAVAQGAYDEVSDMLIEHRQTVEEWRKGYDYHWLFAPVPAAFPKDSRTGQQTIGAEVVGFATGGTIVRLEDIHKVFSERKLRHATVREMLAFGAQYRTVHETTSMYALGSSRCIERGCYEVVVPWLGHVYDKNFKRIGRAVHVSQFGWTYSYSRFLGVRE